MCLCVSRCQRCPPLPAPRLAAPPMPTPGPMAPPTLHSCTHSPMLQVHSGLDPFKEAMLHSLEPLEFEDFEVTEIGTLESGNMTVPLRTDASADALVSSLDLLLKAKKLPLFYMILKVSSPLVCLLACPPPHPTPPAWYPTPPPTPIPAGSHTRRRRRARVRVTLPMVVHPPAPRQQSTPSTSLPSPSSCST